MWNEVKTAAVVLLAVSLVVAVCIGGEPAWVMVPGDNSTPYLDITSRHDGGHGDIHENCHLLCSSLPGGKDPTRQVLYCMRGRSVNLPQPPVTYDAVRKSVPQCLRGQSWKTYFDDEHATRRANEPLSILEEWVCYSNEHEWGKPQFQGPDYFCDFIGYAVVLRSLLDGLEYDSRPLTDWISWQARRTIEQAAKAGADCPTLNALRNDSSTASLREFVRSAFDDETAKLILDKKWAVKKHPAVTSQPDEKQPSGRSRFGFRRILGGVCVGGS